jgi:iron(III) transport system ATP-binding protein
MPASAIEAVDVTKSFGRSRAVRGASLRVDHGQLVALLGPSGSGKTTLLRLIAGFETPDEGRVVVGDRLVAGPGAWVEPDRRRLGMVFQDGALFPHLTVAANVGFGRPRPGRAAECLELVGLAGRASAYPHELSGGERQRIALARALAADPEALLLDEPFAALDEGLRVGLREEVARVLRAAGASALLVTHNQQEALSLADVVAVMRDGRIEQVGPPEEIYDRPVNRWVAEFLGDADVLPGTADGGTVDTELGRFPAGTQLRGAVQVVIRPERVSMTDVDGEPAVAVEAPKAWVVGRSFYGHDQLVQLELAGGARVRSRVPGTTRWRAGQQVRLRVDGVAVVLPDPPAVDAGR